MEEPYCWQRIRRGEALPPNAIYAGATKSDGATFVGRFEGEAGKINAVSSGGKHRMHNFWGHSTGAKEMGEILCCSGCYLWISIQKGQCIPADAVLAGETSTDGLAYVARFNGEAGKINAKDGKMCHFWGHYWKKHKAAEILVAGSKLPTGALRSLAPASLGSESDAISSNSPNPLKGAPLRLRVLQFNVWHEGAEVDKGFEKIVDVIIASDADVVSLNEVRNRRSIDLHERLKMALVDKGHVYHGFYVQELNGGHGSDVGLLSRWPIDYAEQVTAAARSTVVAYHIRARVPICICTAHLDWEQYALNLPRGYDGNTFRRLKRPITDVQELHRVDEASGRGQALRDFVAYAATLPETTPIILAGDFNEGSHLDWTQATKDLYGHSGVVIDWRNSKLLQDAGFCDSWRELFADPVTHPGSTWPSDAFNRSCTSWAEAADERDRIDFIYHNGPKNNLRATSACLVGSPLYYMFGKLRRPTCQSPFLDAVLDMPWPSDHKGLLVDFELDADADAAESPMPIGSIGARPASFRGRSEHELPGQASGLSQRLRGLRHGGLGELMSRCAPSVCGEGTFVDILARMVPEKQAMPGEGHAFDPAVA
mmetsp:Transcript_25854/g.72090  ORF Transcript_25854/g.72090 Transcript_25854/m.72090 type:complete len:598 (+) Transcript_25854:57-1850(+)